MLANHTRRLLAFLVVSIVFGFGLMAAPSSTAFALKERAPVAPVEQKSYAGVLNSQWMEYALVDNPYADEHVTNTDYYTITSTEDPDFSGGVTPVLVDYRYFPEQAPYNGSHKQNKGKIQVFYRAFLKLPSSVKFKEGMTYTLSINTKVANAGPFDFTYDLNKPNLVIHSNQVGYLSEGPKVAYLSHWTGHGSIDFSGYKQFHVLDADTGSKVYTGDITLHIEDDRWSQSDIFAMDFSSLKAEGNYRLYVPGVGTSYPFAVGSRIYKDNIAYTITRALFHQRDGKHGLDNPAFTHWNRPPAHEDDGIDQALYIDNNYDLTKARVDLIGGHMDAGDRGKYPYNSAYVGIDMLLGAKYYPEEIEALGESLEFPESGNGIPDFLDELVYELDWLTKAIMNTSTDGMLANYLRPQSHDPEVGTYEAGLPLDGAKNRMFYNRTQGPNKAETLFAAGVLAQAYNTPIMKKYIDPEKLEGYLTAALRAYNGFKLYENKPDSKNGTYYDQTREGTPHTWSNEMLLAASALLVATGDEEEFEPWIEREMAEDMTDYTSIKHWEWVLDRAWIGVFVSMYENPYLSQELRDWARGGILNYAESEMNHETPFGASTQDEGFPDRIGWRFTSSTLMPLVVGYKVTEDPAKKEAYLERIRKTWDYTLGTNPVSRSFITGLGDPQRSPRWFVHEISQYQWVQHVLGDPANPGWVEPPPGLPNSDLQSAPYPYWFDDAANAVAKTKAYPTYNDHAVMYRYTDSWNTQNEFSVNILSANATSMLPLIPVETRTLTVNSVDGQVLPAGGTYSKGMKLTLTAKGNVGHKFSHWSGDVESEDNSIDITMDRDMNVVANYIDVPVHSVKVTAENGTVTLDHADGRYSENDVATLTAEAMYGFKFSRWSGDATGTEPTIEVEMDRPKNIVAEFVPLKPFTLSTDSDESMGTVKVNPAKANGIYLEDDEIILTAVKKFGYRFTEWTGDYSGTANPAIVKMDGEKEITANFRAVPIYKVTAHTTEGGTVATSVDQPANVQDGMIEEGTLVSLTATAEPGYLFTGWSGDAVSSANPLKIKLSGDRTVTANFQLANGLMSVDVTPTGTPGSSDIADGLYTLATSGNKFGVAPDSFRYLFRAGQKGDAVFTAKLDSFSSDNPEGAAAGIQVRKNLADDSSYAAIMVKNGKLVVQIRKGGIYYDAHPKEPAEQLDVNGPIWLQIKRTINRDIELSWSNDGETWNSYRKETFWGWDGANTELTMGLFASAGQTKEAGETRTASARFSEVQWPGMYYLTVEAGDGGSVTTASGLYNAGADVKLTAVRDAGYSFAGWDKDLTGKANPNTIRMDGNKTVRANFSLMPKTPLLTVGELSGGRIEFDPPGGAYEPDQTVQVKAVPDAGYNFVKWQGDLIGTENPAAIQMDGHKTISAQFVPYKNIDILTQHAGSTDEDENGISVKASGTSLWGENDSFRYVFKENLTGDVDMIAKVTDFDGTAGNALAGIMVRQGTSVTNDYQGIFVTNEKKLRSQFRINGKWTVTEHTGTEAVELPIWLKVEKRGKQLTTYSKTEGGDWIRRGSQTIASFEGPFTAGLAVTAGQDGKFATAAFDDVEWPGALYYTLSTEASGGTISTDLPGPTYPAGSSVTVTAAAYQGYVFTGWSNGLSGLTNPAVVTMDADKTIQANFRPETDRYTLTVHSDHGDVTLDSVQDVYAPGTPVVVRVEPHDGYAFIGWSDDLTGVTNPATVIMDGDKTITANFIRANFGSGDIGTGHAGATEIGETSVTVRGSGTNIWGMSDMFRYVSQNGLTGDHTIAARIDRVTHQGVTPHKDVKVGVMVRQSADADSAHQGIFLDGNRAITPIKRDYAGAWSQRNADPTAPVEGPVWLKVEKVGNVVKTYSSLDGAEWIERSTHQLNLTEPYTMGLVVSAAIDGQYVEAVFSDITWPVPPTGTN